ncbi:undecaprenyldiphospho-muramoylpentapeptide beta-N-acetylglucosaminyltransferase [Thermobrachium celere]|uniref:UDP-N-acetylglucosamine--N-acetylmuramyl-(pentapeptide) pyrophosphoryl-undecaprenol N-acetylglucosamine transferase n=1 Tax=Thermobrachium celere DSM 8682 TaxID=941824 RepID=R7RRE3_9CLOT|nr:undecaprenyldiphospho-muramoylpentapeptide beta-N-acetylglucosaminyltransferase [Thermobrachium celere]GFR35002.1 UDP-N-acetylglucosamine--N-acetylmuramyl-(pentapeptide) pyrophosphoryl-undecaprenol N-acetylglucosamine transferase [Thermobrachium celere]CDF57830.1 UDP-N-acetylglucosamine--N-acetylmuramyl-(pentapeptide) pyrophosphoryl-undecaprenol N-acetylglucosamine transferase [Thermobrachium celere DSM 8682]
MKVIITGGGTGGHIYPGVAIAKKLQEKYKKVEILFVGSENGLEGKLVPKEGYKIKLIPVEGLNKKFSFRTIKSVIKVIKGFGKAGKIINEFKPDIVIGTGGYVCGPVVMQAALKGIPTIIHEQNAFPGVTNKLLSHFVDRIAISFVESEKYFPKNKVVYTGNPVRSQILNSNKEKAIQSLGLEKNKPILLVVGGSRGAKNINNAVVDILGDLNNNNIQLIFITGENNYKEVMDKVNSKYNLSVMKGIKILPYAFNMHDVLAASDLIISRAGATIISEITALGKPSILIPSPYVANNHQEYNARALEEKGACIVIKESQLNGDILKDQIINIINNKEILKNMSIASKRLSKIDAADKIVNIIEEYVK